jgi:hypothetical protein
MEQSKVIVYARFGVDVTQERIDTVKEKIDSFTNMIGTRVMDEHWELLPSGSSSKIIDNIISKCCQERWAILTYDLKTLHEHHSGALSIIDEGADVGVPIFFIEAESVIITMMDKL